MRRPSPAIAISLIALFLSLTGAGMAATGYRITSIWQISPKVRHALRGHTGKQGPQGVAGPQGIQGPSGASFDWTGSQNVFSDRTMLTPDSPTAVVQVNCPAGFVAVTGGFFGQNEIVTVSQDTSNPPALGWVVWAHLEAGAAGGEVGAFAECAKLG